MKLLSPASANTKTRKSAEKAKEYRIVSLMLSPADSAGGKTNCPNSTPSCEAACVGGPEVGLAQVFQRINESRKEKTRFLHADRAGFLKQLREELTTEQRLADREGTTLAVRLNTFSDIVWEHLHFGNIPKHFPAAVFYDYTKLYVRVGNQPENYVLCASWTENPSDQTSCLNLLQAGHNVAVVFAEPGNFTGNRALSQRLPKRWSLGGHSYEVYDGDDSDLRFLDPGPTRAGFGRICGLRLKSGNSQMRLEAMASGFCQILE
jgi:hypothetical protein